METRQDAAMKKAALRKKRKRRRRIFVFSFFLMVMLAIAAVCSLTFLFPIKSISAFGSKLYTNEQIVEASGLSGKNLFTVSEEDVLSNIKHKLPYIETLKLKRSLPDSVSLIVTDAKAYASYSVGNKFYKVSKSGTVLEAEYELPENTFEVKADGVTCNVGDTVSFKDSSTEKLVKNLISCLENNKIKINSIDVTDKNNIKFRVDDRFDVILGSKANYENKIAQLESMIKNIEETRKGTINLSIWNENNRQTSFIPE